MHRPHLTASLTVGFLLLGALASARVSLTEQVTGAWRVTAVLWKGERVGPAPSVVQIFSFGPRGRLEVVTRLEAPDAPKPVTQKGTWKLDSTTLITVISGKEDRQSISFEAASDAKERELVVGKGDQVMRFTRVSSGG
jgi:hypothetical protein